MKISAIPVNNFNKPSYLIKNTTHKKDNSPFKVSNSSQTKPYFYPSTTQYLNFLGGISLNLEETNSALKDEVCPPDIKQMINDELSKGNPDDKTLYDVHFKKYKGVLDCYSLDELKEKYPEFKGVVSSYSFTDSAPDSFIDKFLSGKLEIFKESEDLTLQLIKLYWGQGFSLSDLEKHTAGDNKKGYNLHYTMSKKLHIPLMTSHYANILKLSNKKYNKTFTDNISKRIKDANDEKKQRLEGEPVIIPRGPLSEAHKRHISEGLKDYYLHNPEALYKMSQRQKDFYSEHPEESLLRSQIGNYAWNQTREGKNLKAVLTKFAKKQHVKFSDEELGLKEDMAPEKQSVLALFFKKNGWAKQKLSELLKSVWQGVKEVDKFYDGQSISNYKISFNSMDSTSRRKIEEWIKQNNYITPRTSVGLCAICTQDCPEYTQNIERYNNKINALIARYDTTHEKEADMTASTRQLALIMLKNYVQDKALDYYESKDPDVKFASLDIVMSRVCAKYNIYQKTNEYSKLPTSGLTNSVLENALLDIMMAALNLDCLEVAPVFNECLDEAYKILSTGDRRRIKSIVQ